MKQSYSLSVIFVVIYLAFSITGRAGVEGARFRIVENFKHKPQLDRLIRINDQDFHFTISANQHFNEKTDIIDSKISFLVKKEEKILWNDSLNGKYSVSVSSKEGALSLSNYIGTNLKRKNNWAVLTKRFPTKSTDHQNKIEFWAIIVSGSPASLDVLNNYKNYDSKKSWFVLDIGDASAIVVKIGYIYTVDTEA